MSGAGGLIDTPSQKLNLGRFLLYKHSITSMCFSRSKDKNSVRVRVWLFLFAIACTLAVAEQADIWMAAKGDDVGVLGTVSNMIAVIALTLFVVTPIKITVGCMLEPWSKFLNNTFWCVPKFLFTIKVEEILLAAWLGKIVYFAMFADVAATAHKKVGPYAVAAFLLFEIPVLLIQYSCMNKCCKSCLPEESDFGMADRV